MNAWLRYTGWVDRQVRAHGIQGFHSMIPIAVLAPNLVLFDLNEPLRLTILSLSGLLALLLFGVEFYFAWADFKRTHSGAGATDERNG